MQHYTAEQWQQYKDAPPGDPSAARMENHLLQCPICLERFLGLISQEDLLQAEQFLSPDFTGETIGLVNAKSNHSVCPIRSSHSSSRKKLFGYYVAAAVLTLALTGGGVFDSLIHQSSQVTDLCIKNSLQIQEGFYAKIPRTVKQSEKWLQTLTNITRGGTYNEYQK